MTLHFRQPFHIAYESVETADIVLVRLVDDKGREGLGCAAPDPEVTGETAESDMTALLSRLNVDFFTRPIDDLQEYHHLLTSAFLGLPAASSAAEEALLNLWAQRRKDGLSSLFSLKRTSCPATVTIGISDLEATLAEAGRRVAEGFTVLKLKCGISLQDDCERIAAVRKSHPGVTLLLDANQGYSLSEAKDLLHLSMNWKIAAIEQPLPAEDHEGLLRLQKFTTIPIIADESAVSVEDAAALLAQGIGGVNVKLMKCGGPRNAAAIIQEAKRLKRMVILGCMYESNISITTATHLALAFPVDYADLDSGHFDFDDDPVEGGAAIRSGHLTIDRPLRLKKDPAYYHLRTTAF